MRTVMKFAVVISVMLLSAALAFSQPEPGGPGGPGGPGEGKDLPPKLIKKLGLTEEQQEKVKSIRMNAEKEKIKIEAELRIKQIDMQEQLEKKSVNEKEVSKLIDGIADLQKKMLENRIKTILALKKILTPEQQEKIKKFMEMRMEKLGEGGPMGPGGFQGGPGTKNKMKKKFMNQPGMENFQGGPGGPGFQGPMKNKMPFNNMNPEENDGEGMAPSHPSQSEMSFLHVGTF